MNTCLHFLNCVALLMWYSFFYCLNLIIISSYTMISKSKLYLIYCYVMIFKRCVFTKKEKHVMVISIPV